MKTDVVSRLHAAENAAAAFDALVNAEKSVLPPPTGETTKRARRGAA